MLNNFKKKISKISNNEKYISFFAGFISGFYPFMFYYSNNFASINSKAQISYYFAYYILIPVVLFYILFKFFSKIELLSRYKFYMLFVLIIITTSALLSQAMFLTYKKKALLAILLLSILLSIRYYKQYKKLLLLILIVSIIPMFKNIVHVYSYFKPQEWRLITDNIELIEFKEKPNVYLIQPDGYVSKKTLNNNPYRHTSDLYLWLEEHNFKVYNSFRSNYPASLTSNSSLFSMKQHKFDGALFPTLEVMKSREIICGNNPVITILKNNGYFTNFIVQDEYFQQNRSVIKYHYQNIKYKNIPYTCDGNTVKQDVFLDLKSVMAKNISLKQPKFYFIEKLLPHHVHFKGSLEADRNQYTSRVNDVNKWLKTTINYIEKHDKKSLIIILADHGGWLGIENYTEMYTTVDENKIRSIYSTLAAIKWNNHLIEDYDIDLKTHVNVFRVLFANLAKDKQLLNNLEDNSSYNLRKNSFSNSIYKVIDDKGNCVSEQQ